MHRANDPGTDRAGAAPSRRAVIGGGLAVGATAWAVPTIVSVSAASAATVPPEILIDPFTVPDSVTGEAESTVAIGPIGAITATRRLQTVLPGSTLSVASGLASFAGPSTSAATIDYVFGSPLDLSGTTSLSAPTTLTGNVAMRLFIDFVGGSFFVVDATTTSPEMRFDLTGFTPLQLSGVTSFTVRIGAQPLGDLQIGPLTAR